MQPVALYLLFAIHMLMGIATAGVALASGNIAMKLSPAGQATGFLAASSVVSASCAAIAPVIGGLCADFFAAHQLTFAFTWKGDAQDVTVQVLDFHSWTFLFGLAFVVGLYSTIVFHSSRKRRAPPTHCRCVICCWRRAGRCGWWRRDRKRGLDFGWFGTE